MTNQTDLGTSPTSFTAWVKKAYGTRDPQYYDHPKMFMPQVDWLSDDNGNIAMNCIVRFENLERDFQKLCAKLGVKANLPHLKPSNRGDFRRYYDQESFDIVNEWFAQDIATFGYTFEQCSHPSST